jgi:hypothetical protein
LWFSSVPPLKLWNRIWNLAKDTLPIHH